MPEIYLLIIVRVNKKDQYMKILNRTNEKWGHINCECFFKLHFFLLVIIDIKKNFAHHEYKFISIERKYKNPLYIFTYLELLSRH